MSEAAAGDDSRARMITLLVYALYALTLLSGFPILLAVAINLLARPRVQGTVYESHFAWQMKTNEIGLLLGVPGLVLYALGPSLHELIGAVGALLLLLAFGLICWRALRGFAFWTQRQPVPVRTASTG